MVQSAISCVEKYSGSSPASHSLLPDCYPPSLCQGSLRRPLDYHYNQNHKKGKGKIQSVHLEYSAQTRFSPFSTDLAGYPPYYQCGEKAIVLFGYSQDRRPVSHHAGRMQVKQEIQSFFLEYSAYVNLVRSSASAASADRFSCSPYAAAPAAGQFCPAAYSAPASFSAHP